METTKIIGITMESCRQRLLDYIEYSEQYGTHLGYSECHAFVLGLHGYPDTPENKGKCLDWFRSRRSGKMFKLNRYSIFAPTEYDPRYVVKDKKRKYHIIRPLPNNADNPDC